MIKLGRTLACVAIATSIFSACSSTTTGGNSTQATNIPTLREALTAAPKPVVEPLPTNENEVDFVLRTMKDNFKESGTRVTVNRTNKIFILTLADELTSAFVLALDGNGEAISIVESVFESTRKLSPSVYDRCGYSVGIANPLAPDKLIYGAYDGIEVFSYLD